MAANAQAICTSFKVEILNGIHALGTTVVRAGTTADTFKAALFTVNSSITAATTAYSATGEVASGGTYSAGGATVTFNAPTSTSTTAFAQPSADISWTGVTFASFDCLLIYNSTQSNKAVGSYTFGAQTIASGNLTLTMPANDSTHALIQLA